MGGGGTVPRISERSERSENAGEVSSSSRTWPAFCGDSPHFSRPFQSLARGLRSVATFSMFDHELGLFIFWRSSFRNGWILAKMKNISALQPGCTNSSSCSAPCNTNDAAMYPNSC